MNTTELIDVHQDLMERIEEKRTELHNLELQAHHTLLAIQEQCTHNMRESPLGPWGDGINTCTKCGKREQY